MRAAGSEGGAAASLCQGLLGASPPALPAPRVPGSWASPVPSLDLRQHPHRCLLRTACLALRGPCPGVSLHSLAGSRTSKGVRSFFFPDSHRLSAVSWAGGQTRRRAFSRSPISSLSLEAVLAAGSAEPPALLLSAHLLRAAPPLRHSRPATVLGGPCSSPRHQPMGRSPGSVRVSGCHSSFSNWHPVPTLTCSRPRACCPLLGGTAAQGPVTAVGGRSMAPALF